MVAATLGLLRPSLTTGSVMLGQITASPSVGTRSGAKFVGRRGWRRLRRPLPHDPRGLPAVRRHPPRRRRQLRCLLSSCPRGEPRAVPRRTRRTDRRDPARPRANKTGDVWHVFVHGLSSDISLRLPRQRTQPHRRPAIVSISSAVLLDPYARALSGDHRWGHPDCAARPAQWPADAAVAVLSPMTFDWEDDVPPATPMAQTVIYELHVRGYTRHPSSGRRPPRHVPGTDRQNSLLASRWA